jgi:uncharacterized protein YbjQ (UPF0145 family)
MRTRRLVCSAIAGVLWSAAAVNAMAQDLAQQAPLRVFDATELTPDRYTVIKRIWVESRRSAFRVPSHSDSGAAIAALTAEATRLGADAVTNLICLSDRVPSLERRYFCYGLAIKLR